MFSIMGTRRTKIFAYGFMLTIVACTVYIAFTPSTGSGGRTAGSPWFSSFFSNATSSTRSYRSQFSTFISRFFNGSSESDGSLGSQGGGVLGVKEVFGSKKDGVLGRDQSNATVKSSQNAIFGMNQTVSGVGSSRNRSMEKNMTGLGVEFLKGGILVKNQTSLGDDVPFEKGMLVKKEASPGVMPSKSSVIAEDQICSGIASSKDGSNLDKNLTCSSQNGISTKNQTTSDVRALDSRGLANDKAKVETPASVLQQQTKVSPAVRKNETSESNIALDLKTKMVSKNNTRVQVSPARHNASPPAKNGNPAIAKESTNSDTSGRSKVSNFLASSVAGRGGNKKREWSLESMKKCDIYKGGWVKDESYPLYPEGSCPHIDEPFDCFHNGRLDRMYQKLRWQPDDCNIPRMNASDMLERLRGKRLVFVGDSLNRNMWESLVCILRNSITDKRKVFEASGRHEFRTEGSYSVLFKDYNCTVEFFRSPFLVQEWEMPDTNGKKKETLRLDLIERSSSKYKDANAIVFNTGHWWTHEKTSKGKDYYQEGNQVYNELNVVNAFHKALNTWAKWIDVNINPHKTLVIFRGYSASHFRGGQWNSGGQCDKETEPIKNEKFLSSYPPKMSILESVLKEMKTPVSYLNITRLTDYRKDAHPSVYRKQKLTEEERRSPERYQDCSHWCLPGVPDSWNELLYIQLVLRDIK